MPDETTKLITELHTDMQWVKQKLNKLDEKYVYRSEFVPVKKIAYGLVSLLLCGVVGAVLGLVLIQPARAILIALISS